MSAVFNYILRAGLYERLIMLAELLLIGLAVYIIVSFLEGTRGERLFRGIILILIVGSLMLNLVVRKFGMDRIDFLYKSFLIAVLIIAVTAFQPELRRALIRIGQTRFFIQSTPQQLTRSVEEILKAVARLAASSTGAIIVIPQQVPLGEFIETGLRIDARVSCDLILTVFYEGTPLHDMAMIIQGDRIVAARVQLPLAEADSSIRGTLGSRHRAAIGVTTTSDAVVIVVSEETGVVSIALNGRLIQNVSEAQLRRHLTTAVVETTPLIECMSAAAKDAEPADTDKT